MQSGLSVYGFKYDSSLSSGTRKMFLGNFELANKTFSTLSQDGNTEHGYVGGDGANNSQGLIKCSNISAYMIQSK